MQGEELMRGIRDARLKNLHIMADLRLGRPEASAAEQALQEREMSFHEIYKRCDEKERYPEGRTDQQDH